MTDRPLVTVIVPVLNRPQNAEPFMSSLRASTDRAWVIPICSSGKDGPAWIWAGGIPLLTRDVSFPKKANYALNWAATPYVFLTGDDVRFHPGWLEAAIAADADVVGTNDLGNPRVIAGEHGTHLLIRRSYIQERGASWDGPGVLCHEGYRHWFVDDEIVQVAKERGVWASASDSIVEHLHPVWGKAPDDGTYALADNFRERDLELFRYRALKYAALHA